jgi:hypothetical protein
VKLPLLISSSALTLEGVERPDQPVFVSSRDSISLYERMVPLAEHGNSRST